RNADIHIHDLSMLTCYCAGWSLKQLIQEGLGGVPGKITSSPAGHLSTLCNQMVNFLGIMQNEWAGAQAFSSFDTYLAPFVKVDNLSYKEVKQCIQSFIYGVNTPSRWGTQSPFTNITLDWTVPNDLAELNCIVGGKEVDFRYKDCKKEMDMINKAFIEIMVEGDANGRGFQYPIPTYSITRNFDWSETENNKLLFEMTAKYGTPYFSNYINSDMEPSDVRSMCCRLRLDLRELRKKSGGFFGSGESTGSVGVVTINMPRIAYLSDNKEDFMRRLDKLMDISARSLKVKRTVITKLLDNGLYPYTKRYLGTFNNHFSTIGLVGMNEAGLNAKWLKKDMTHKETQDFTAEVLNHMRERLSDYQEEYGDLYNLEATPAESTAYRFAKHDLEQFPSIITAAKTDDDTPYYTNSSHLPVGYTEDIFSALDIQDELQTLYTSGTVFHAFLGEKLPDWKAAANLVRKIAENYRLPYYTMSPTYSVCKNHGYISGEVYRCPDCGEATEVYSRITGYYRPVQNWNDGKSQEFKDRKVYDIGRSNLTHEGVKAQECACEEPKAQQTAADGVYLVATTTCPNCKIAAATLEKAGVSFEKVYADKEPEKAQAFSIKQAPTLVIVNNGNIEKYTGVSDIKKYLGK
ncbi:MAG: ribonucleoside triphosphate reductase, partial [Oscillospiraceae bacterium]|nr:ribonucleoside triphosphate reductase [Candidatus Equicaccousia limihippi]